MIKYSSADVVEALDGAHNINASVKKFLKKEVGSDSKSERFAKDLKAVFSGKDPASKERFVGAKLPDYEPHLLVLARYAYNEPAQALADEITGRYAEEFNQTYTPKDEGIEVRDKAKFIKIGKEVVSIITSESPKRGLPSSGFMMKVMLHHIFDKAVLDELESLGL
ncbi:MAG: hypothetical protein J5J00_01200 [Deltaproteobacteria bacterium]|nr:hypothetical protein [Deltaproteobacteria bacterium]